MEKPILIARRDFVKDIFELINRSGLPPLLVEYILRDVLSEVNRAVQDELCKQEQTYCKTSSEVEKKVAALAKYATE